MKSKIAFSSFALSLLAAALAFAPAARAQYTTSSSWWGIRAGANLASQSFDSLPSSATTSLKAGVIGGLAYEHWFNDTWGIDASLLYDMKGVSEQYSSSAKIRQDTITPDIVYSGNDNYTLSYIEVPIVLKFAFGMGSIRPYVAAGPSFGYLLSASDATDGAHGIQPVSDLKSYLNSVDMSLYFGLGIADEIYRGPMILFDAGYSLGLTKIYKSAPPRSTISGTESEFPHTINPVSAKSGDIRITLGIMWPIGQEY